MTEDQEQPNYWQEGATSTYRDETYQGSIAKLNDVQVWHKIFEKYLTNPADKINLLLASPNYFEPFLREEKCTLFFGEVAHILHKRKYLTLSNSEFLEFRCLSKSCKMSLDNSLQTNNPCFLSLDGIDHDKEDPAHVCWSYLSINNHSSIYDKIEIYAELIRNETFALGISSPFVTGSIMFQDCTINEEKMVAHRENFKLILATFGTRISYFQMNLWSFEQWSEIDELPTQSTKYQLLGELLEMMPNLKSLKLEDYGDRRNDFELDYECGMSDFDLPDLDHLVALKISNVTTWVVDTIVRKYGPTLNTLSVNVCSWLMDELWYDGLILPATDLLELSLPPIGGEVNFEDFLKANVSCPFSLTSISFVIGLKTESNHKFQDMTAALLQVFGNSEQLNTINISVLNEENDGYTDSGNANHSTFFSMEDRVELPCITRLWIFVEQVDFNTIDFILGLRNSLEELVLNLKRWFPQKRNAPELIQFFGYWNRMEESNVWSMMPRLQKITIRCTKVEKGKYNISMACHEYNRPSKLVSFA